MKISDNVYQQLMSQAADKMTELYDKVKSQDEELEALRAQLAEAREALKYIADYGNYATEGEIETSDGVMHVSDYAGKKL